MNRPIGVFDSGLGGLTVAGEVLRRLPNERIVYFADSAHVPYGERPPVEIQEFAVGIIRFLLGHGAKTIVMACNMSSAVALDLAKATFPGVPILGMIDPGSRAAVAEMDGPIGVLATSGTVKSGAYERTIRRLCPDAEVYQQACPAFVPIVESGRVDTEEAEVAVRSCVEPLLLGGVKSIVLGCTHYPFLRQVIERVAPNVRIIDPAEETVRELQNILEDKDALAGQNPSDDHLFCASGDTDGFAKLGSRFLGREISHVKHARWGVDLHLETSRVESAK